MLGRLAGEAVSVLGLSRRLAGEYEGGLQQGTQRVGSGDHTGGLECTVISCKGLRGNLSEAVDSLYREAGHHFLARVPDAVAIGIYKQCAGDHARQGHARGNNVILSRRDGIRDRQLTGRGIGKEAVAA